MRIAVFAIHAFRWKICVLGFAKNKLNAQVGVWIGKPGSSFTKLWEWIGKPNSRIAKLKVRIPVFKYILFFFFFFTVGVEGLCTFLKSIKHLIWMFWLSAHLVFIWYPLGPLSWRIVEYMYLYRILYSVVINIAYCTIIYYSTYYHVLQSHIHSLSILSGTHVHLFIHAII